MRTIYCETVLVSVPEFDNTPVERYVYNVPLFGQHLIRRNRSGELQKTGYYHCWYAANKMLSSFFFLNPRMPLPITDDPLEDYDKFEQLEGLRRIPRKGPLTPRNLLKMLKRYGPLFATIMTSIMAPDGTYFPMGHAIVVTGIHGTMVYYNDPNHPSRINSIGK